MTVLFLLLAALLASCDGFYNPWKGRNGSYLHRTATSIHPRQQRLLHRKKEDADEESPEPCVRDELPDLSRRDVLQYVSAAVLATWSLPAHAQTATTTTSQLSPPISSATDPNRVVDLQCLQDLPPSSTSFPNNTASSTKRIVRIFFCRHGQTENNRLRKVQGARVDPDINDNGITQSTNLGRALHNSGIAPTTVIAHSPLQRAKHTAEIVAAQLQQQQSTTTTTTTTLDNLREIDFGPIADGQPVLTVQKTMMQTYAAWSVGQVDYRPQGGGESGREVLGRACNAISELVDLAVAKKTQAVVAVTHSAYLRVLLGVLLDEPLLQAASRKVYNGSVTVVDVLLVDGNGNRLQQQSKQQRRSTIRFPPKDLELEKMLDPSTIRVVRVNEFRHLPPSTLQQL